MAISSIGTVSRAIYLPTEMRVRAAFVCFLAAFITGGFGPLIGLVSPEVAKHYQVDVSHIVYLDVLNIVGLIIGNVVSGRLIARFGCYRALMFCATLGMLAQWSIALALPLPVYAFCALLNGFSMGILVPSVSQTMVIAYHAEGKSASRLSILNFFFSFGSAVMLFGGGYIAGYFSWRDVFLVLGFIYSLILIAGIFCHYREQTDTSLPEEATGTGEALPEPARPKLITFNVILIGLALVCYVYVEYIASYWFSPYLQIVKGVSVVEVGQMLSGFWITIAIFRLLIGLFVLTRIKPSTYILITCGIIIAGFGLFIAANSVPMYWAAIILIGLGCSSLFPTLLGYGVNQAPYDSPIVTSFLITCGSAGAALCLFTSATLGEYINKEDPIFFGPTLPILITLLVSGVLWRQYRQSKAEKQQPVPNHHP